MLLNYNMQFINFSIALLFFLSINGYLYINSKNKNEFNKPDVFIDVKVIHSTSSSTISKFSIDSGKVTGYFLERESGTNAEEREAGSMKRIPPSTYEFVKNDCFRYLYNSKRPNCAIEFRLVTKTNKEVGNRNLILIHTGNYPFNTKGCIIPGSSYKLKGEHIREYRDRITFKLKKEKFIADAVYQSKITLERINKYIDKRIKELKASGRDNIIMKIRLR